MITANAFETELALAAYTHDNSIGCLFTFGLSYTPQENNTFHAECEFGEALLKEVQRTLFILYTVKNTWQLLKGQFTLSSMYQDYIAGSTSSAGLGIAISLFNLARMVNGSAPVSDVLGTGFIRLNGNIESVDGIEHKSRAVIDSGRGYKKMLTAEDLNHLYFLDRVLVS